MSHLRASWPPAGSPALDYVSPDRAQGWGREPCSSSSTFGNQAFDTFNTLNVYVLKGDGAAGMDMTFDSLMARALDEPDALYGLVARSVATSPDGLTQTLQAAARGAFP